MKYLLILLLFCSCASYRHKQEQSALGNVIKENKIGYKTDSLYDLKKNNLKQQ